MADAGRARPEPPRTRRWWSPVALVAIAAAALLIAGPWTPLASIGLGSGCASAATTNHVGVVVDSSQAGQQPATNCVAWLTGLTPKDALLAVYKDQVQFDANGRACFIKGPSGGCASPPPGYWAFATSDGKGSWTQQDKTVRQDQPIPNDTVVGWKFIVGNESQQQTPAVAPNLATICPPTSTPTSGTTKTPTPTPTPTHTTTPTTTSAPGSGSNPGTTTTGGNTPPYTPATGQPTSPAYSGLPSDGTTTGGTGGLDTGNVNPGALPANKGAAYDTTETTRWGLILVAAGFALVIVTTGLFGTNVYLSRKSAQKGRHRRSERRRFAV